VRSRFVTIVLLGLVASRVIAEDDCGSMVRTAVRFRATVEVSSVQTRQIREREWLSVYELKIVRPH
jgi:hypothetical protein